MYENILSSLKAAADHDRETSNYYINHGYCLSWAPENRKESDEGIRRYSTELRWNQYQAGIISREQAVSYAIARNNKKAAAELDKKIARLDEIAKAPDLDTIHIFVEWKRSSVWGLNPHAEIVDNTGRSTYGNASGCGYDKLSSAIASAMNENNAILKILCNIKEAALIAGKSDRSSGACTGRDNREVCGYGAGYSPIPYFEGGVGASCFWSILSRAGYTTTSHETKKTDTFIITKTA